MFLGNFNFLTAWVLLRGKFRAFFKNGEVRLLGLLSASGIALLFIFVTRGLYAGLGKQIRVAIFEAVSALTTTGFSTEGYGNWPPSAVLVLIILMLVGGGVCSTAGGLKQFRVYLLAKAVGWEVMRTLLPRRAVIVHRVTVGDEERTIHARQIAETSVFVFLYLALFFAGAFLVSTYGTTLRDSLFEFASALGTVGLSVGVTSASAPDAVLWAETAAMFLGRLEFFVVFTALGHLLRRALRK